MANIARKPERRDRGYILVVTALSSVALVAFVGLAADTGYLSWVRRRAQTAADAAAMSASLALKKGLSLSTAQTDGQTIAGLNGFTNGSNNTTVTINHPPLYGSFAGNNSYAEAIVRQTVPNMFMMILGQNSTTVGARSTAALGSSNSGCIYVLNPTAAQAIWLSGSNTVTFACSAYAASTASNAYQSVGSITLDLANSAKVGVVGGYVLNQGTYIYDVAAQQNTTPITVSSVTDPLSALTAPTGLTTVKTSATQYDHNSPPPGNTIGPGVYCGGLTIGNPNGATYTMTAGTYVMAGGGFNMTNLGSVNATAGVTIYNTNSTGYGCTTTYAFAPIIITGQSVINLNAPASGALAGIAFFQDRSLGTSSTINQINSMTTSTINGAFYFKNSEMEWTGANVSSGYIIVVCDTLSINGNSNLYINNNYSSLTNGSPIPSAMTALVE